MNNINLIDLCGLYKTVGGYAKYEDIESLFDKCPDYLYTDKHCYKKVKFDDDNEKDLKWSKFVYEAIRLDCRYGELTINDETQEWLSTADIISILNEDEFIEECSNISELIDIEFKRNISGINDEVIRLEHRINCLKEERNELSKFYTESIGKKIKFNYER